MDSHPITMVVVLLVLIALSAFFSATETAFMSLNRAKIKSRAQAGNKRAAKVLKLCESGDMLLSTILIGNNIVNIAATSIATVLFVGLFRENGATVSTVVMTVSVLIFGEITPKSLAKERPEAYALAVVDVVSLLNTLLKPLTFLLVKMKRLIGRLFRGEADTAITDDELLTIVDEAEQEGGIDSEEGELLRNVIEFKDLEAIDIFTPRIDMTAVEVGTPREEILALFRQTGFSRIPVYRDTVDDIIGIINEKDFHAQIVGTEKPLETILQPALFIPPSVKIADLLKQLQQKKTHMAVIVDEFGGTEGIVTMEDILEELVGEIFDEHDEAEAEIRPLAENRFAVPTSTELDEFFERFGITEETDASTVNGWVISHIGKIPAVGDCFDFENLTVQVTATDEQRAEELTVTVRPAETAESAAAES